MNDTEIETLAETILLEIGFGTCTPVGGAQAKQVVTKLLEQWYQEIKDDWANMHDRPYGDE